MHMICVVMLSMTKSVDVQELESELRDFLRHIVGFLTTRSMYISVSVRVIYMQDLQKVSNGYISRGLMRFDRHVCPFQVMYDMNSDTLELTSEAFVYYLSRDELHRFLEYGIK